MDVGGRRGQVRRDQQAARRLDRGEDVDGVAQVARAEVGECWAGGCGCWWWWECGVQPARGAVDGAEELGVGHVAVARAEVGGRDGDGGVDAGGGRLGGGVVEDVREEAAVWLVCCRGGRHDCWGRMGRF